MLSRIRSWPPEVLVAWIGFALFLPLIFTSPHRLTCDEPAYMNLVYLLNQLGFSVEFLRHLPGHAGLLYTIVQYATEPVTALQAPWVRLVNPILFLGAARLLSTHSREPHMGAQLLGCPFIGISIGMALTEIPAFFLVCGALLIFFQAKEKIFADFGIGLMQALLAGVCFGLAILGRQTYAVVLLAFLLLISQPRQALVYGFFVFAAAAVFGPIFYIWGGYLPPVAEKGTTGLAWNFAALAFAYTGFATLFIAPRFLFMPWNMGGRDRGYGHRDQFSFSFHCLRAGHWPRLPSFLDGNQIDPDFRLFDAIDYSRRHHPRSLPSGGLEIPGGPHLSFLSGGVPVAFCGMRKNERHLQQPLHRLCVAVFYLRTAPLL